jgi:hypothetical protein
MNISYSDALVFFGATRGIDPGRQAYVRFNG